MYVFAIYDVKAEAFLRPFFEKSEGLAIRAFTEAANDEQHQFYKHAEDFQLFKLGMWDEVGGHIDTMESPVPLGMALTFKVTQTEQQISNIMNGQTQPIAEVHKTGE